jgi:hypothetical protein
MRETSNSQNLKKYWDRSPERKKATSERLKAYWADPEHRKQSSEQKKRINCISKQVIDKEYLTTVIGLICSVNVRNPDNKLLSYEVLVDTAKIMRKNMKLWTRNNKNMYIAALYQASKLVLDRFDNHLLIREPPLISAERFKRKLLQWSYDAYEAVFEKDS